MRKREDTNVQYDSVGEAGLRFFGQVSASITHEMKNVLAIINENTGLLEDLTYAAKKGAAIDPERLNRACQQFTKQVQRADWIMKNMNCFAHSVDSFDSQINLYEVAGLVANLAGRPAAMRKLAITVRPPTEILVFSGNPFLLENMIWICLQFAFGAAGAGTTLLLTPAREDSGITLRIGGIDNLDHEFARRLPSGYEHLLSALNARISADVPTGELVLHLT